MKTLHISQKLCFLSFTLCGLLAITTGLGLWATLSLSHQLDIEYQSRTRPLVELAMGLENMHRARDALMLVFKTPNKAVADVQIKKMQALDAAVALHLAAVTQAPSDENERQTMQRLQTSWDSYRQARHSTVEGMGREDFMTARIAFNTEAEPMFAKLPVDIEALLEVKQMVALSAYTASQEHARRIRMVLMAIALAGLLLAVLMSIWLIRSVTRPLAQAVRVAVQIAAGDLTTPITVLQNDETGKLLTALAAMQQHLRTIITGISQSSASLHSAAHTIHSAYVDIRSGSAEQSNTLSAIAAALQQMSVCFDDVAARTGGTLQRTDHAHALADQGTQQAQFATSEVERIAESVLIASNNLSKLEAHAERIATIAAVIKEIAGQTNLLALNAAIEAARAGEQGRGFAVVADEVRKLAEKTSTATSDIMAVLSAVRSETHEVVGAMRASTSLIDGGVKVIRELLPALQELKRGASIASADLHELDVAYSEQAKATQTIAHNVDAIARLTESTDTLIGSSGNTVNDIEILAGELKASINLFRL